MSQIMKVQEVAAYLRLNRMTIYRLAQEGTLPAFKVGGSWRFDRQRLDEWIVQQIKNFSTGNNRRKKSS